MQSEQNQKTQISENNIDEEKPEDNLIKENIKEDEEVKQEDKETVSVEILEDSQQKTTYGIKVAENIEVDIKALDRCWIYVTKDGQFEYEGIINNGETKSFQANNDIIMRIGNPLKIELVLNGVNVGVPGGNARDFVFEKKDRS